MPLYEPVNYHLENEPDYYPTTHLDLSDFPPAPTGGEWNDKIKMDPSSSVHDQHPLPGVLVDSWFGSTINNEVEKSHLPAIESDQPMNEGVGTGYLFGRDGGRITDDSIVPVHQVQRATYPMNIRPKDSLTQ
ncbi:hypothetical protein GUITHDRAFT_151779 [Guillardia theta CCMP2712]|uniref:Uncharacterized protein n=1 Tax=Guillardia theta (strain CCMP2712) TaxID=905079 RepID=L1JJ84_GUITC|nr:hypothetical protein GUITHDRAFT_151779 [Guillardia theta CCMP2712]EKX48561.1 hypothetical protein GUITHDRAFT_151779 [Guillardia theta CCMP2712]|eukprot:XP_005835541.1 hypothetical protein GUITHDRAFT_151779 [Guillardia theta CCMP2712]